jgi:hypothetical protein
MKSLIKAVTQLTGVDITNKSSRRKFVYARALYFKAYKECYPYESLRIIGKSVNKDRTTAFNAIKEFDNYVRYDESLSKYYVLLLQDISSLNNEETKRVQEVDRLNEIIIYQQNEINELKLMMPNTIGNRIDKLINNSQNATVLVERMEAFLKMNS